MDEKVMPYIKRTEKVLPGITASLTSAVLEWFLIFLLFIEASFSFFVTKFARYSRLQIPCLLCSRLDHILGKEKAGFYWDLICVKHKLKISSLVLCRSHSNLVDVHGMCENCLFSFATFNKSNLETFRLLVGKSGAEPLLGLDHDPLLVGQNRGSSGTRSCSCCNEKWISRGYSSELFQMESIGSKGAELDTPLSVTVGDDRGDSKIIRDETYRAGKISPTSMSNFNPLPHFEYKKVKITSDSESEALMSDNEDANFLLHEEHTSRDFSAQYSLPEPQIITLAGDLASEKLIDPTSVPEPSQKEKLEDIDANESANFLLDEYTSKDLAAQSAVPEPQNTTVTDDLASDKLIDPTSVPETSPEAMLEVSDTQYTARAAAPVECGLEEHKRQQVEHKIANSASPELISFDEALPPSRDTAGPTEDSGELLDTREEAEQGREEVQENAGSKAASQPISTTEVQLHLKPDTSDTSLQRPSLLELGDAYKIALGSRGRQLSGKLMEQLSFKESSRASEDFRILLSQLSASRGIEISLTDMSPRVTGNGDELKTSDASGSVGMKILQKRISLERNESGLSLDGSTVYEIEGEGVVDRLNRQVEHDKKLLSALLKELEEERNASAVAANQAMAMITRLQEEKAALHMEALQCLRMMEEESEYDVEALEKANNLLAEKEKEIRDLRAELEMYKKKFGLLSEFQDRMGLFCETIVEEIRAEDVDTTS